jgi:hypothetical protein
MERSKRWKFPAYIDETPMKKAREYLDNINWTAGLALSCDDSKLHPDLRTYWDSTHDSLILVGQAGPVRVIKDESDLKETLSGQHGDLEKATKVSELYAR